MAETPYVVRLDPWAAEYEGALQLPGNQETIEHVDVTVETETWAPLRPSPARAPRRILFIDGVRRVEHRLLVEDGQRTFFGILGSYAVGATDVSDVARVVHESVERVASVGGGMLLPAFEVQVGPTRLTFVGEAAAENTPVAPVQALQTAMRRGEAALAAGLQNEADLVMLDGPLTFLADAGAPVVGYVKRLQHDYLSADAAQVLPRLRVGERTPVFLISTRGSGRQRYSWYARIGSGRRIDSPLAGVVRLETASGIGLAEALRRADQTAAYLPRFASSPARDPRAPQNLYPIGGLEASLRHRLGDPLVIRRAIEARLHQEAYA